MKIRSIRWNVGCASIEEFLHPDQVWPNEGSISDPPHTGDGVYLSFRSLIHLCDVWGFSQRENTLKSKACFCHYFKPLVLLSGWVQSKLSPCTKYFCTFSGLESLICQRQGTQHLVRDALGHPLRGPITALSAGLAAFIIIKQEHLLSNCEEAKPGLASPCTYNQL